MDLICSNTPVPDAAGAILVVSENGDILSPKIAPVYFVMGDIGWGLMLGSWAVQLALVLILYKVSGRVYDRLIIYTGRRIKLGEILAMAGKGEK